MRRVTVSLLLLAFSACSGGPRTEPGKPPWHDLLAESAREQWARTVYGGEGEVAFDDEGVIFEFGSPLTGIHWTGPELPVPVDDYELACVAERIDGTDFFCGLTFPVGKDHATLILGGWGGALVGLSCIDGENASENETRSAHRFVDGTPYRIRIRVRERRILAWLDGTQILDVDARERQLSLHPAVELSKPLGVTAFATRSRIRQLHIRRGPDRQ